MARDLSARGLPLGAEQSAISSWGPCPASGLEPYLWRHYSRQQALTRLPDRPLSKSLQWLRGTGLHETSDRRLSAGF